MSSDRVYRWVIRGFRAVFALLGLRFDVRGSHHIPAAGPAVLACNHLSYLDFTFVGLAARSRHRFVRFMAKAAVFDNALAGPLMRAMGHIPVDRESGAAAYRKAARALAAGEVVGVFPEATISRSCTLKSFKRGAATLAVRERVPLIPVVLWAPQRTFTADRHYSFRRGKAITVIVGEPIRTGPADDPVAVDVELKRQMQLLLEKAWQTYPDAPRDDTDRWWIPKELGGTAPDLAEAALREQAYNERRAARKAAKGRPATPRAGR